MTQQLHGRRGAVFAIRVTSEERAELEKLQGQLGGPHALGAWMRWRALGGVRGTTRARPERHHHRVLPARAGGRSKKKLSRANVFLERGIDLPKHRRVILDLCAGTGAWSEPYRKAGYRVLRITLPQHDVRVWRSPRARVWGVLCAPPCEEFSIARNGSPKTRDFAAGMACVNACLRIVLQTKPVWWALENPTGMLSMFLGTPRDVWEPCEFGDPWTKRTALWGSFVIPKRGPFVKPISGKTRLARSAAERARTPAGFARAFFEANP